MSKVAVTHHRSKKRKEEDTSEIRTEVKYMGIIGTHSKCWDAAVVTILDGALFCCDSFARARRLFVDLPAAVRHVKAGSL
jgi:hypothetical protein